ncbi:OLC1v1001668C1 [Oldenlandia corymbosa var. corymbosa]|uniref:OLC1v1001668C1 n=1 Tax=Oldenlandia corymbosa var. corymbosa TaxID=529605 RepID=A0AAV1D620_OLDCO|nr:OLC1v1001668C1 [Oldenlandia corymbosa var. corymbosa]
MQNKHFSHVHALVHHQIPQDEETQCSGCKLPASGKAYACLECNYFLHDQCFQARRSLRHSSHPSHPLMLSSCPTYPTNSFNCNICNLVGNGFSYCCSECEFDLHVHCALKPNPTPPNYSMPQNPPFVSPYPDYSNFNPGVRPGFNPPPSSIPAQQAQNFNPNNANFPSIYDIQEANRAAEAVDAAYARARLQARGRLNALNLI